tara:strand:+ start:46 stop:198 length:153 start_codon:yes stop_codon:yes gene_type:complete
MKQEMVTIPKKEYEFMKEELELLRNPQAMKEIAESVLNIKNENIEKLDVD